VVESVVWNREVVLALNILVCVLLIIIGVDIGLLIGSDVPAVSLNGFLMSVLTGGYVALVFKRNQDFYSVKSDLYTSFCEVTVIRSMKASKDGTDFKRTFFKLEDPDDIDFHIFIKEFSRFSRRFEISGFYCAASIVRNMNMSFYEEIDEIDSKIIVGYRESIRYLWRERWVRVIEDLSPPKRCFIPIPMEWMGGKVHYRKVVSRDSKIIH